MIHKKIFERLCTLAERGQAPYVMIDQVFVGEDKLRYAQISAGKTIILVVSTEVTTAIERAFQRGMSAQLPEHGRFEDTKNVLRCHKKFAEQLPTTLAKFIDSNTYAKILDNNVDLGMSPECAAMIFLSQSDKRLLILNKEAMINFIRKIHINENATKPSEVYPQQLQIQDDDINQFLNSIPIKIEYEGATNSTAMTSRK